jgi:hypothetical protein
MSLANVDSAAWLLEEAGGDPICLSWDTQLVADFVVLYLKELRAKECAAHVPFPIICPEH